MFAYCLQATGLLSHWEGTLSKSVTGDVPECCSQEYWGLSLYYYSVIINNKLVRGLQYIYMKHLNVQDKGKVQVNHDLLNDIRMA